MRSFGVWGVERVWAGGEGASAAIAATLCCGLDPRGTRNAGLDRARRNN